MYFILLLIIATVTNIQAQEGCWWTGCQKNNWAVVGCEQYNLTEIAKKDCEGGHLFHCCPKSGETKVVTTEKSVKTKKDCWWTGCQKNNWAVVGCNQYNRTQDNIKDCDAGHEYYCCAKEPEPATEAPKDCWWTGCQKNNWAVVGCAQYNRTQTEIRDCEDGREYNCCVMPKNNGTSPDKRDDIECWWTACQPTEWATRGCPQDMKQEGIQSCGTGNGDMFNCCGKKQKIQISDYDPSTGRTFTDEVKYLLLKGRNFTLVPDSLPCLSIDSDKKALFQVDNSGIYICDLCPRFPQKRIVDVFLSRDPVEIKPNVIFGECYGDCFDRKDCVAFSYDYERHLCYMFNSTVGFYVTEKKWTTVIMTQPVGIIEGWTYSRHTSIMGDEFASSVEKSFMTCLDKCNKHQDCNYASYQFSASNCLMYATQQNISYVDLSYGHISVFRISSLSVEDDVSARFIEQGDDLSISTRNDGSAANKKCSEGKNETHSAFYSKECLTSDNVGCDTSTGCKRCYYPENSGTYENLPVCPDSDLIALRDVKNKIQNSMRKCLADEACAGVGYNSKNENSEILTFSTLGNSEFTTRFTLRYPATNGANSNILKKYDFLLNYDIGKCSQKLESFQEHSGKSFKECMMLFESNNNSKIMSYSNSKCKISSEVVKFAYTTENSITVTKKPALTSSLINFVRTPGLTIPENIAKAKVESCQNCESDCADKCNTDYKSWCSHFTVNGANGSPCGSSEQRCMFFDLFNDTYASNVQLQSSDSAQIFTKISSLDFTLDSFNELNPFQSTDIYNCFSNDDESEQTQTTLSMGSKDGNESNGLRRKRNIFKKIGNAFKSIGKAIVNTVKSIVKPVVDTVKGVVGAVKNVIKGDFKKAKESIVNIPIVKDVKNAVELGKAVVTGDWKKAKEKGAELLQSSTLDIATSFIPVGGKLIGRGLSAIGKAIGKTTSKAGKGASKTINKTSGSNKKNPKNTKKPEEKKPDNRKKEEERKQCKKRKKRELTGEKRKQPGDCNDESKSGDCPAPIIDHAIKDRANEIKRCRNRRVNNVCEFECLPGYDEPRRHVACVREGKKDPFWNPRPTCTLVKCPVGPYPLIPLHTPQISSFGDIQFGQHLTAYVLLFNKARRLPVWSVALHQSDQFESRDYNQLKESDRAEQFGDYPCPELTGHQAKKIDYTNSGWDRGHLTPANVARWSDKAAMSSNLYINVAPQDPHTNQVPWKQMEAHVECFSKTNRSLVATGICDASIGKTKTGLDVPKCYWKLICYKDEKDNEQVIGFISDNSHPRSKPDRAKQVYTPVPQSDVRKLFSSAFNPWTMTATEINKGRPLQVGALTTVRFPINPFKCDTALDSKEERDAWFLALTAVKLSRMSLGPKKRAKKKSGGVTKKPRTTKKKKRTRRAAPETPKLKRGCHSKAELRNMMSMLDLDTEDDVDLDPEDYEEDDDRGGDIATNVASCNKRIIGYYTSWLDKEIEGRQLQRLTHVIYAFLEMTEDGSIDIGSADRKNSADVKQETEKATKRLVNLMQLADSYPHLKVMFAVGGWENSQYFSSMAGNPSKRITFIGSIVKLIKRFGFDGVDIDWEYPVTGGANEGIPQDKQNYVLLMKEVRTALDTLASDSGRKDKYLLSFAGAAGQWTLDPGFDLPGLLKYVDFANIMSYDYFGAWASKWGAYTGPPAPLHFGMPPGFSGKTNVDWSVKHYTCKTKLPHKINMGVPFYGRYWKNVGDPVDGKDGMWRKAAAVGGKFEGGYVPFDKIESFLGTGGFEKSFHEKSKTPYAFNPGTKTFLGYENAKSMEFKVKYAEEKNIGGLMIWAVEQDDDSLSLLKTVASANLCSKTNPTEVNFKCIPIDEKRWWTPEDGEDKAGLCGKSAPLYKGYYPVCDPDDPGYNCCGSAGYCGTGEKYCGCPTCKNYGDDPKKILEEPIKPSVPVTWYLLNDADGKRGRCGRKIPKINGVFPTCNPDDQNSHCCSNGGYCGNTEEHCKCNGCIDFKAKPNYRFGPKKWWDQGDGKDKEGKCGPNAPKIDGQTAECEPNTKFSCCSNNGFCGSGPDYCDCKGCKKYTE